MYKNKTIIIAEAGVNYNGKISQALKLIDVASESGADIVKFQTFTADNLVTKTAPKAIYQKKNTGKSETQFEMLKKLELKKKDHFKLIEHCKRRRIQFLSTGFNIEDIKFLVEKCKLNLIKIPSGEITNYPLLKYVAKLNKNIIMSTGMANIREIKKAMSILKKFGTKKKKIFIMHCITEYPANENILNLNTILFLKERLKTNQVGYSDHSTSVVAPSIAVALGAKIIEKHFTLDKKMKGPDHKASLNPAELKDMIHKIRVTEKMLGVKEKKITYNEILNSKIVRKSIVAKEKISKGEKFSEKNLTTKRPGTGISAIDWPKLIGKKSKKFFKVNELIK